MAGMRYPPPFHTYVSHATARSRLHRSQRRRNKDPSTPDVHKACSKRAFDGQIKKWRRQLHEWDPPAQGGEGTSDVALATGAVMSLEASTPAGQEGPAPSADTVSSRRGGSCGGCSVRSGNPPAWSPPVSRRVLRPPQEREVIPGSKKGRELRGSGSLLPRLFGRSGTNKRRPELGNQEETGEQPDSRATKKGWFTTMRVPREVVSTEPGMPEVDYRCRLGKGGTMGSSEGEVFTDCHQAAALFQHGLGASRV